MNRLLFLCVCWLFGTGGSLSAQAAFTPGTYTSASPRGYDATLVPIAMVGRMLRVTGLFDYLFTTTSKNGEQFFSSYLNLMRDDEAKGLFKRRLTIGTIVFDEESGFSEDKFQVDSRGTKIFRVLEGKPGYVMLLEYRAGEQSVDLTPYKIEY